MYPTTGVYGSILQAYFGSASSSQKQDLWDEFQVVKGAPIWPTNPSGTTPVLPEEEAFLQFIQFSYLNQGNIALSPQQIQQFQVQLQLFSSLLKMMSTIQNSVAVEANNLTFLTKWQQQYTEMLADTPVYIGSPTNSWSPSTDPTQFTLGYNAITVNDLSTSLSNTLATQGINSGASFTLPTTTGTINPSLSSSSSSVNGLASFNLYLNTVYYQGQAYAQLDIAAYGSGGNLANSQVVNSVTFTPDQSNTPAAIQSNTANWNRIIMQALTQPPSGFSFNGNFVATYIPPSSSNPTGGYTLDTYDDGQNLLNTSTVSGVSIPWRDANPVPNPNNTATLTTAQQQDNTNASGQRADLNALLQQYIQTATANRQTIQNTQSTMQNNLSQSQQAISNESNLMTSMIQTWQSILSSIYQQ